MSTPNSNGMPPSILPPGMEYLRQGYQPPVPPQSASQPVQATSNPAQAYQNLNAQPAPSDMASAASPNRGDISMTDAPEVRRPSSPSCCFRRYYHETTSTDLLLKIQSSAPPSQTNANATTPRTGTPVRNTTTNGDTSSRAASQHPDTNVTAASMPTEVPLHGAPTRQYLNSKVTVHVMEGMKLIAKEQYVERN